METTKEGLRSMKHFVESLGLDRVKGFNESLLRKQPRKN